LEYRIVGFGLYSFVALVAQLSAVAPAPLEQFENGRVLTPQQFGSPLWVTFYLGVHAGGKILVGLGRVIVDLVVVG
jgi:hypothetical protein